MKNSIALLLGLVFSLNTFAGESIELPSGEVTFQCQSKTETRADRKSVHNVEFKIAADRQTLVMTEYFIRGVIGGYTDGGVTYGARQFTDHKGFEDPVTFYYSEVRGSAQVYWAKKPTRWNKLFATDTYPVDEFNLELNQNLLSNVWINLGLSDYSAYQVMLNCKISD